MNKSKFRVYLRALEMEDYILIHSFRQNEDVIYGYSGMHQFASSENEKKWVEERIFDKNIVTAGICLKEKAMF